MSDALNTAETLIPSRRPNALPLAWARSRTARAVGNWAAAVLLAAILLGGLIALLAPPVVGWHFLVVTGSSMEPTIPLDSLAVMADVDGRDVRPGEIVTIQVQGGTRTHRVVAISADGSQLTTKGDANGSLDLDPVPVEAVTGRYLFSIPFAGTVIHLAASRSGYLLLVLIPAAILLAGQLLAFRRYRQRRSATGHRSARDSYVAEAGPLFGARTPERFKANHGSRR